MSNVYHMPEEDKRNVIKFRIEMAKLKAQTDFKAGIQRGYPEINALYGKYSKPARAYMKMSNKLNGVQDEQQ